MSEKYYVAESSKSPSLEYEVPTWAEELPESIPQWPGMQKATVKPSSIQEREIAAAHHALDALGVPAVADLDVTCDGEKETRFATHDLRLHGRIAFLAQHLGDMGISMPLSVTGREAPPPLE